MKDFTKNSIPRENFLLMLLNKVTQEYKKLQQDFRDMKPLKIIEIPHLSKVPGETEFLIQPAIKSNVAKLTAAQIIKQGYDLTLFSDFHADLIRLAAQGKIIEFLGAEDKKIEDRNGLLDEFTRFYQEYQVRKDSLRFVKYRINTTIEEYKRENKIQLSFTDKSGGSLPLMSVEEIKLSPDLIAGLHPMDVNSINDLYYLSRDKIVEMKISDNILTVTNHERTVTTYCLSGEIDMEAIRSTRVAYMIGYLQAEKLIRSAYQEEVGYRIVRDNICSLYIKDVKSGETVLKNPQDILFSNEYQRYSKNDIARIAYICGQLSKLN